MIRDQLEEIEKLRDEELYDLCRANIEEAWLYLFNYILGLVRWYRFNKYPDLEDLLGASCEDIAAECMSHVFEVALPKVREPSRFRAFVRVVVHHKLMTLLSRTFRDRDRKADKVEKMGEDEPADPVEDLKGDAGFGLEPYKMKRLLKLLFEKLNRISRECRDTLAEYMKIKMGVYADYAELSAKVGLNVSTIAARVHRCLRTLLSQSDIPNDLIAFVETFYNLSNIKPEAESIT